MSDPRRRRPPERALRWVCETLGARSRIVAVRRLTGGGWHANHALAVADRQGGVRRFVLRRWARPEWRVEDPDFTPEREAAVLELVAGSSLPAPRLVAADPEGAICDVPALLITHIPGRPPGLPRDMDSFLAQLAGAMAVIHELDASPIPAYRTYYDIGAMAPPPWSRRPGLWARAIEEASGPPPPGAHCFIHRDFHPDNTLWSRDRLTGVVDWTTASSGPAAVDAGHMRWNLALTYGVDAADAFLRLVEPAGEQRHWDLVTVLDLVAEFDPREWPRFDLERLERYVASVVNGG